MIKKTYRNHKETIHNYIWRALQVFGKQGIIFLIFILAAKLLSPYNFGIYNYILAIIFFLVMFGDFGISTATSKYVAEYDVTDKRKLKLVLFNSGIIILGLTIVISLITIFFGKFYLGDKYIYVLYLLPLIFLAPMTSLYDGIYRGLKKFKQLSLISIIVGIISLSFVYFLVKQYGLIGALVAQNLFYFILFLALAFGHGKFSLKLNKKIIMEIGRYALIIGISSLAYFLYSRIDIIILGKFNYLTEIGYYEIINQSFMILTIPFIILAQVFAPNISRLNILGKKEEIKLKFKKYFKFIIVIGILVSFLMYFIFPVIIKIFLGEYFTPIMISSFTLLLFLLPSKVWGVFQTQGFLVPAGFAKILTVTTLIGGILNIILDYIFIQRIGFIGVFIVTLVIHTFNIWIQTSYFYKKIND